MSILLISEDIATHIQGQLGVELDVEACDDEEITFATEQFLLAPQYVGAPIPDPAPLTKIFLRFATCH